MVSLRATMHLLGFHGMKVCLLPSCTGFVNLRHRAFPRLNQTFRTLRNSRSVNPSVSDKEIVSTEFFPNVPLLELGFKKQDALDICEEDVSDFSPPLEPSLNFAAYVNRSPTLQEFAKLGVELYKFERNVQLCNYILSLDFERDVKNYLLFLHNIGVPGESFGRFITKNPLFFKEDLENLQIRVNYLQSKRFKPEGISRIVTLCPRWLSHTVQDIDSRLGFFQQTFYLSGSDVRLVTERMPKLILLETTSVSEKVFQFRELMGFEKEDLRTLVMNAPDLFVRSSWKTLAAFNIFHNEIGFSHETLLKDPAVLATRANRLKARHGFLKLLGRDQYDPKKENYVSPLALVSGTDVEFCEKIAKTSIDSYNTFLKSL